ncbi:class I SAM-dependent methyltransferase [Streptomyces sp. NPDC051940]|uniref:class I SAM-dependent methyltransferase n=1 Tax=Streptomyces sp. NPDC051940 TaxID=3155675 RepID=UPI0034236202
MTDSGRQTGYWDGVGATKTFTHPLNPAWLAELDPDARILDYGCGYGRLTAELGDLGFTDVSGVDVSRPLIERGRALHPGLGLAVLESPPSMPGEASAFDAVLLFAVLTCVPDDADQRALIAELHRVLAPGGLLYVSDLLLQDDARNRARYAADPGAVHGVFTTEDGARCRHHELAALRALLADFDLEGEDRVEVATMNGHRSRGVQLLARKR